MHLQTQTCTRNLADNVLRYCGGKKGNMQLLIRIMHA